ncbi:hypothetical protein GGX14DRAFT_404263 [Mycena pura]|uniref:Uncharacterized protein n=1 Tax=Mycena pura TaxID=153505 RepID=A0AAD6Y7S1_9AGAR|nr:hypothetical protein GGX14DRAFT_404263 [Mycena pura]
MLSVVWVKNSVFGLKQYARRKSERRLERENSVWQRTRTATRGLYKGEYDYGKKLAGKEERDTSMGWWVGERNDASGRMRAWRRCSMRAAKARGGSNARTPSGSERGPTQRSRGSPEGWERQTEKQPDNKEIGRIVAWVTGNGMKEMPAKNRIQDEKLEVVGQRLQEPEILATLVGAETNGGGLRSGPAGMRTADPGRVKVDTLGTNSEAVRRGSHALVGDNIVNSSGLCQLLERRKEGKKRRQRQDARLAEMTPVKGL